VAEIEAFKNNDRDLKKVEFTQVDQPGSVGFLVTLKVFGLHFQLSSRSLKPLNTLRLKPLHKSVFMVVINSIDTQTV
jgi:hypothetical protein